jgi:hypothetical protein
MFTPLWAIADASTSEVQTHQRKGIRGTRIYRPQFCSPRSMYTLATVVGIFHRQVGIVLTC